MIKYKLYDSFPNKPAAKEYAKDLRKDGYRVSVKKGDFGLNARKQRLTYGVYIGGFRKYRN